MPFEKFELDSRTKLFLKELYRDYRLKSRTRHNHIADILDPEGMSNVQPSIITAVEPLMIQKLKDNNIADTRQLLIQIVRDTEKTFSKQMGGPQKKDFVIGVLKQLVEIDEAEEKTVSGLIDLVVMVAKNQDIYKIFKPVKTWCLCCLGACQKSKK